MRPPGALAAGLDRLEEKRVVVVLLRNGLRTVGLLVEVRM
jgi:hypothetical protein